MFKKKKTNEEIAEEQTALEPTLRDDVTPESEENGEERVQTDTPEPEPDETSEPDSGPEEEGPAPEAQPPITREDFAKAIGLLEEIAENLRRVFKERHDRLEEASSLPDLKGSRGIGTDSGNSIFDIARRALR